MKPIHVLVADDIPESALLLAALIVLNDGVSTDTGYDGSQAVALAHVKRPDLVLTDVEMPFLNGIDAAVAIKQMHRDAPPLICAVTGNVALAEAARVNGVFDCVLQKPVAIHDLEHLLALVRARIGNAPVEWAAP